MPTEPQGRTAMPGRPLPEWESARSRPLAPRRYTRRLLRLLSLTLLMSSVVLGATGVPRSDLYNRLIGWTLAGDFSKVLKGLDFLESSEPPDVGDEVGPLLAAARATASNQDARGLEWALGAIVTHDVVHQLDETLVLVRQPELALKVYKQAALSYLPLSKLIERRDPAQNVALRLLWKQGFAALTPGSVYNERNPFATSHLAADLNEIRRRLLALWPTGMGGTR